MTIETSFDSNYRKVLVAARRARQIAERLRGSVPSHSTKACRIAQEEIEAGKISYVKTEAGCQAAGGRSGIPILLLRTGFTVSRCAGAHVQWRAAMRADASRFAA